MLELINNERTKAGVVPVLLGESPAAQLHADDMLQNCFSGHWGSDGLKPYMRYSLAGGYKSEGENVVGLDYCIKTSDWYLPIQSIKKKLREVMDELMDSSGHRRNILRSSHRKVNIGLAWDDYNFKAVQQFEGDHIDFDSLPMIEGGVLSMTGMVKNGASIEDEQDLGIQIFYDPLPVHLTRGQISRTYCYSHGRQIAALRPSLSGNWYYSDDEYERLYRPCREPFEIPSDAPGPRSADEAHRFWLEAYGDSIARETVSIMVPWVTASEWEVSGSAFLVTADIGRLMDENGDGVYSLVVWARLDGEDIIVSEYSIFVDDT